MIRPNSRTKTAGQWLEQWRYAALNGNDSVMHLIAVAAAGDGVVVATTGRICAYCDPSTPWGFNRCGACSGPLPVSP